jgi:hypothetical protein
MEATEKLGSGHEDGCARVCHGELQPCIGPSGIQWYISGTGAHDAESSDDPVKRPLHANRHRAPSDDTTLRQISGQAIGRAIELFVTQLSIAIAQGNGSGLGVPEHFDFFCNRLKILP